MNEEIINKLKRLAREEVWSDNEDFNAMDNSGGNFDDTFCAGQNDGQTQLARVVLHSLGIHWWQNEEI